MNRNFYSAEHAPYYICALDYIQQSAGIRALHYLCHALNESGMEAYVTCQQIVPQLRTPVLNSQALEHHHLAGRKPIVVYPEIIPGDPLETGGVVVRWLLNRPGLIGGDTTFPDDNLIFAYDMHYLPQGMEGEPLHIPTCDLSIFNNGNNPDDEARELVCFYAHKYLAQGGQLTEQAKGAVSLCKDQKLSPQALAAILRKSRVLYVYEPTALIAEALLCGCPVVVIESDYWRENTANYSYTSDWGVVMDDRPESVALASANVHNYRSFHENTVLKDAWEHLDRFIELTQLAARTRNR